MDNVWENNFYIVQESAACKKSLAELADIEEFIAHMGLQSFCQDFIMCRNKILSLQGVMTSIELTLSNIHLCCEHACFADANTLLRKYRDDLFFYLYLVVFNNQKMLGKSDKALDAMEENINRWIENNLKDLHIGEILKAIVSMKELSTASRQYDFQKSFDKIGCRLNNFVHSNGCSFYNQNAIAYNRKDLEDYLKKVVEDLRYITTTFMFLLVLCTPSMAMSSDYVDYLDSHELPPEGSQYWVAPFIDRFFHQNISCIDETCLDYLRENTPMEF